MWGCPAGVCYRATSSTAAAACDREDLPPPRRGFEWLTRLCWFVRGSYKPRSSHLIHGGLVRGWYAPRDFRGSAPRKRRREEATSRRSDGEGVWAANVGIELRDSSVTNRILVRRLQTYSLHNCPKERRTGAYSSEMLDRLCFTKFRGRERGWWSVGLVSRLLLVDKSREQELEEQHT